MISTLSVIFSYDAIQAVTVWRIKSNYALNLFFQMTIMRENINFMWSTKSKCGHKIRTSAWFSLAIIKDLMHSSNKWLFCFFCFFKGQKNKTKTWQTGCQWNNVSAFPLNIYCPHVAARQPCWLTKNRVFTAVFRFCRLALWKSVRM